MGWLSLTDEVADLFGALSDDDRLETALDTEAARRRLRDVERVALWRASNPERTRAMKRKQRRRWRQRNPELHRESNRRWYARKAQKAKAS